MFCTDIGHPVHVVAMKCGCDQTSLKWRQSAQSELNSTLGGELG